MNPRQARTMAGLALAALLAAGCSSGPPPAATASAPQSATAPSAVSQPARAPGAVSHPATSHPAAPPSATRHVPVNRNKWPAGWTLPDRRLSPGAVQPGYGLRDICPHVNPALEAMRPSTAGKEAVYRAYGIFSHPTGKYEVDHIIPIELLGEAGEDLSDPTRNLYPEPNDTPDPAMLRKYGLSRAFVHNSKDILEDVLHGDVCAGRVPLATAQRAIMTDWRTAYARYVGPPPGSSPPSSHGYRSLAAPYPTHSRENLSPPSPDTSAVRIPPPSSHAAAGGCYPKTDGGNCYRAGEFCRKSDLGTAGVAGNGEAIRCEASGSRNRWEPA